MVTILLGIITNTLYDTGGFFVKHIDNKDTPITKPRLDALHEPPPSIHNPSTEYDSPSSRPKARYQLPAKAPDYFGKEPIMPSAIEEALRYQPPILGTASGATNANEPNLLGHNYIVRLFEHSATDDSLTAIVGNSQNTQR